jgi:hypothetical protein
MVGDDGATIVNFMHEVMIDEGHRTGDRLEAAKWLADRGFGRARQRQEEMAGGLECSFEEANLAKLSLSELMTLQAILEKAVGDA